MKAVAALACSMLLVACGAGAPAAPAAPSPPFAPGVSVPVAIAEGRPQPSQMITPSPSASASAAAAKPEPSLPDPEPLRLERQWEYELTYDRGNITVTNVRPLLYSKPVVTPRRVGRYAIELWIGRELIDRIRFDFPALAAEEPPVAGDRRPLHEPVSLAPGATVRRIVLVPASPRATRAVLVDRATGETIALPWPPDRPLAPIEPRLERAVSGSTLTPSGGAGAGVAHPSETASPDQAAPPDE